MNAAIRVVMLGCATAMLMASLPAMAQSVNSGPSAATSASEPRALSMETALVEDLIDADIDGYREAAYVVRWHGSRVLVTSRQPHTTAQVGDSLRFMVLRLRLRKQGLLQFIAQDQPDKPTNPSSAPAPTTLPSMQFNAKSASATIEEPLQSTDGNYHFVAYIARYGAQRVAVVDPLADRLHAAGDPLDLTEIRSDVGATKRLSFTLDLKKVDTATVSAATQDFGDPKSPTAQASGISFSSDTGLVEQVLSQPIEGNGYLSYLVRWHGTLVAVDGLQAPDFQAGDAIPLRVTRVKFPNPLTGGMLVFTIAPQEHPDETSPALARSANQSARMTPETGSVETLLFAQDGEYRYRAYVVKWQGARIVVPDVMASTQLIEGSPISFSALAFSVDGKKAITFMLFAAPCGLLKQTCNENVHH